jgi:hypothetical protein
MRRSLFILYAVLTKWIHEDSWKRQECVVLVCLKALRVLTNPWHQQSFPDVSEDNNMVQRHSPMYAPLTFSGRKTELSIHCSTVYAYARESSSVYIAQLYMHMQGSPVQYTLLNCICISNRNTNSNTLEPHRPQHVLSPSSIFPPPSSHWAFIPTTKFRCTLINAIVQFFTFF